MASDLAYFILSDEDHDYLRLRDVLVEHYASATDNEIVDFVKLIPHGLLCDGLKWGFGDTEVRDNIYAWMLGNLEKVNKIYEHLY